MPASSTTRFSCTSPQRPRTCGARSAVTRLPVSARSRSCPSATARSCSPTPSRLASALLLELACAWLSNRCSVSLIGASFASVELEQGALALRERIARRGLEPLLPLLLRALEQLEPLGRSSRSRSSASSRAASAARAQRRRRRRRRARPSRSEQDRAMSRRTVERASDGADKKSAPASPKTYRS